MCFFSQCEIAREQSRGIRLLNELGRPGLVSWRALVRTSTHLGSPAIALGKLQGLRVIADAQAGDNNSSVDSGELG